MLYPATADVAAVLKVWKQLVIRGDEVWSRAGGQSEISKPLSQMLVMATGDLCAGALS